MAENKKGFMLYVDLIHTVKKLPNEKAGELFKHILEYVNDNDPKTDDLVISISFEPIKQQLKRDLNKYYKTCERNKINGSKGGRPKNPTEPKKPSGLIGNPTEPKKPDTDTDTDTDIDTIKRFKELDFETLFMKLGISPDLIIKYRDEFATKISLEPDKEWNEVKRWFINWVKLQPKLNLNYLTDQEKQNRGLNPKREYVHSKVDGSDYAGLLSDKEKQQQGLDVNRVYTIQNNLVI